MSKEEFCSCKDPELITTTVAVFRAGDKDDEYQFCKKCKKEYKETLEKRVDRVLGGWYDGSGNFSKTGTELKAYCEEKESQFVKETQGKMKSLFQEMCDKIEKSIKDMGKVKLNVPKDKK